MQESLIADIGVSVMNSLLEDESETKAGEKHAKRDGHAAYPNGYDEGSVVMAGQKWSILKLHLRVGGTAVPLVRYGLFQSLRRMWAAAQRRMLAKVSTRRYAQVVDGVAGSFGMQKSSVSRHWRGASAEELYALLSSCLGSLDLCALLIDGVYFEDDHGDPLGGWRCVAAGLFTRENHHFAANTGVLDQGRTGVRIPIAALAWHAWQPASSPMRRAQPSRRRCST